MFAALYVLSMYINYLEHFIYSKNVYTVWLIYFEGFTSFSLKNKSNEILQKMQRKFN